MTIVLTIGLNTMSFACALLTKWRQFQACTSEGFGCVPDLLDALQLFLLAIFFQLESIILICYPPCNQRRPRLVIAAANILTVLLWLGCIAINLAAPCSPAALGLASGLAYAGGIFAITMFLPQLMETVRQQRSGALSASFYILQAAGGYAIFVIQAFLSRDNWVVWAPMLVSTLVETACGVLAIYYDCRNSYRLRRQARAGLLQHIEPSGSAPLLDDDRR
jgi:uncharacterized protein with PQ loop repeat